MLMEIPVQFLRHTRLAKAKDLVAALDRGDENKADQILGEILTIKEIPSVNGGFLSKDEFADLLDEFHGACQLNARYIKT